MGIKCVTKISICSNKHETTLVQQLTHSLIIGKNMADTNNPSNGPPTIPNILSATCRIKLPKNWARNARPIVAIPNERAANKKLKK